MRRFMGGSFRIALFAVLAMVAGGMSGQAPTTEPPQRKLPTRPPIPRRPGFGVPERPGFNRPGWTAPAADARPPKYAVEVTGSKRAAGVYRSMVYTTHSPAQAWEAYFPVATEMPRQSDVRTSMEPAADVLIESSRARRPYLRARLPVGDVQAPQAVELTLRYEATLHGRRLVPVPAGQKVKPVSPLTFMERAAGLVITPNVDFRSEAFGAWLDGHQLRRAKGEDDVDFARRVFLAMLPLYTYRDGVEPGPISGLCTREDLDCDTLSLLFVGAMRGSLVPARVVYGWPLRSLRHEPGRPLSGHTQAEFFAEGVGWVPVDLAYGILHRADDPLTYFGQDEGTLLIAQVDPDYMIRHGDGTVERVISIHPGPSCWSRGRGTKADVAIRPLSWDVEVSPAPEPSTGPATKPSAEPARRVAP